MGNNLLWSFFCSQLASKCPIVRLSSCCLLEGRLISFQEQLAQSLPLRKRATPLMMNLSALPLEAMFSVHSNFSLSRLK